MLAHHQQGVETLTRLFSQDSEVLAIFLGGSVAKGTARPDSDIDAMVVVTDDCLERRRQNGTMTEVLFGYCDYPGGYFDLKYLNRAGLLAAAERGSEPARNAYVKSRCLFTRDPALEEIAARIGVFQTREKPEKLLSFYASFFMSAGYLWETGVGKDAYYRYKTASDLVYFGLRLYLQDREVLFPSHRRLAETVRAQGPDGERLVQLGETLLHVMDSPAKEAFVQAVRSVLSYTPPEDLSLILTRYTQDNELWWRDGAPVLSEW